jgi:hypothetical protein
LALTSRLIILQIIGFNLFQFPSIYFQFPADISSKILPCTSFWRCPTSIYCLSFKTNFPVPWLVPSSSQTSSIGHSIASISFSSLKIPDEVQSPLNPFPPHLLAQALTTLHPAFCDALPLNFLWIFRVQYFCFPP